MRAGITFSAFNLIKYFKCKDARISKTLIRLFNFRLTWKVYFKEKTVELYYNSRDHRFSSSGLRKQIKTSEDK